MTSPIKIDHQKLSTAWTTIWWSGFISPVSESIRILYRHTRGCAYASGVWLSVTVTVCSGNTCWRCNTCAKYATCASNAPGARLQPRSIACSRRRLSSLSPPPLPRCNSSHVHNPNGGDASWFRNKGRKDGCGDMKRGRVRGKEWRSEGGGRGERNVDSLASRYPLAPSSEKTNPPAAK